MLNNIAFDLDGVLADVLFVFTQVYENLYGEPYSINNCKEHDLCPSTGLSPRQVLEIFDHCYDFYDQTPIYPGASELFAKLYEKTKEPPLILTARPVSHATQTYKLARRAAGKTPFQLVIKSPDISKACYLAGRYRYFVEDRRATVLELQSVGIDPILVRRPYNEIDGNGHIWQIDGVHELIPKIKLFVRE